MGQVLHTKMVQVNFAFSFIIIIKENKMIFYSKLHAPTQQEFFKCKKKLFAYTQFASKVLGRPAKLIYINETKTSVVPNTIATGMSTESDLNGMAVKVSFSSVFGKIKTYKIN